MAFKAGDRVVVQTGVNEGKPGEVVYPLRDGRYFVILDGFSTADGQRVYRETSLKAEVVEPPPSPPPPPAELYVSPSGNDVADGTNPASALRTFGEAYRRAKPRDTVLVLDGAYPKQVLVSDGRSSGAPVVFKAANASVAGLALGDSYDQVGASYVQFENLDIQGWLDARRTNTTIVKDCKVQGVFGAGARNLEFYGGEIGPHRGTGGHPEFTAYNRPGNLVLPEGLVLDGVKVHGIQRATKFDQGREIHINALHIQDGKRIVIRNCVFEDNDIFDILVNGSGHAPIELELENNVFGVTHDVAGQGTGFYSVYFDGRSAPIDVSLSGNRFDLPYTRVGDVEVVGA